MGLFSIFGSLFKPKKGHIWTRTPEEYLAMILYLQRKGDRPYSEMEVLRLGEIMQKVLQVNLDPYRDFPDLLKHGIPDYTAVEVVESKMIEVQQRIELKKAIYGENVDLGDDDVMSSNSEDAIASRKMVDDLSKYIKFKDEE